MSERNWIIRSALGIVAAVFIGLTGYALATAPTASDVLEVEDRDAEYISSQKEYAIGYDSERGILFTVTRSKSAGENEDIASDTNHHPLILGQRDLLAQERMSHWTKYLGIFTGVGVVLLLLTLHETNETANQARAMLTEQKRTDELTLRAFVTFEVERTNDNRRVILIIKNVGETPALNVCVSKRAYAAPEMRPRSNPLPPTDWGLSLAGGLAIAPSASIRYPLTITEKEERDIMQRGELFIVYAGVAYHDEWTYRSDDENEHRATRQYFTAEKAEYESGGLLIPVPDHSGMM